MANSQNIFSTKRLQIDKANSLVVIILAITSFITVFSLISCKALLSQREYQSKVISEKVATLKQLKTNNDEASKLADSYKVFVSAPVNVIGGSTGGQGDKDGDNGRIILDALPSKYDFPALATSLEKILVGKKFKLISISGTDDELNQAAKNNETSVTPVEIPFQVSVEGDVGSIQELFGVLMQSIRPINISSLTLQGTDNNMQVSITAKTYYQPQKVINISTKVIK